MNYNDLKMLQKNEINRLTGLKIVQDSPKCNSKIKKKRSQTQDKILKIQVVDEEEEDSGYESAHEKDKKLYLEN